MLKQLNRTTAGIKQNYPVKVLQFGDGNFLRGFADWIIDILNEKTDFNGSLQLVRPLRNSNEPKPLEQDGLYHVVQRGLLNGQTISETRLITCVSESIHPYLEFQRFLKAAENPDLQFIFSNTTEAGIVFKPSDTSEHSIPETFPGKLTLLLFHRFKFLNQKQTKGFVILPCELIEKNGDALRTAVLQYVSHWNLPDDFKSWVLEHNTFCNTLVDRIVPGFPKDTVDEIQNKLGYEDRQLVMVEPYHLLVVEAPDWVRKIFPVEQAGLNVKFVGDVTPYRVRKVRILNGAHTALVPIAYLRGLRFVNESVNDAYVGEFLKKAVQEEIIPTLDLSEQELKQFAADVMERFKNPFVRHELISIALNSISKFKVRVLPTVLEFNRRTGKLPHRLLQSLAALILFYRGEWNGETIPLKDSPEVLAFFKDAWQSNSVDVVVSKTLSNISFWDCDLTKVNGLEKSVTEKVKELLSAN